MHLYGSYVCASAWINLHYPAKVSGELLLLTINSATLSLSLTQGNNRRDCMWTVKKTHLRCCELEVHASHTKRTDDLVWLTSRLRGVNQQRIEILTLSKHCQSHYIPPYALSIFHNATSPCYIFTPISSLSLSPKLKLYLLLCAKYTVVEPECEKSSATTYFWYRQTLNTTSTIAESGGLNVKMTLSLLVAWIIVCLAVIRGIASSGKVVVEDETEMKWT